MPLKTIIEYRQASNEAAYSLIFDAELGSQHRSYAAKLSPDNKVGGRSRNHRGNLMNIFKTMVTFSGHDEGSFHLMDTIFHEGHWWLVASWLVSNDTGMRTPERIIRMGGVSAKFQEVHNQEYRFLLQNALPISVVDGKTQDGYVVAIHPASLSIQGPKSVH